MNYFTFRLPRASSNAECGSGIERQMLLHIELALMALTCLPSLRRSAIVRGVGIAVGFLSPSPNVCLRDESLLYKRIQ